MNYFLQNWILLWLVCGIQLTPSLYEVPKALCVVKLNIIKLIEQCSWKLKIFATTWSSKHVSAVLETRRDIWAELDVARSQRIVITPRDNAPAWRGGGAAL